jgi:predicted RNase H-like nuclease (RuvC/YqgF family)
MSKIREAYFQVEGAATSAEFAQADALLGEALAWMKNGWEGFNTVTQLISSIVSSGIMTREDREQCWAEWKESKEFLRLRRDEYYAEVRVRQIGRLRDWVEQNENMIETLQGEIDRCEELEWDARTEEFAERVRGRIEAKSLKISDLESRNEQLETKIAETESRLGN